MPIRVWLAAVLWFCLCIGGSAARAAGEGAPPPYCNQQRGIALAGLNWDSGAFLTEMLRAILERGFDCHVETIPGNSVTLEQALANNDIQIFAEEWVSRGDIWKQAAAKGQVRAIGHPFADAVEGWFVADFVVHGDQARQIAPLAADLHAVEQLKEPRFIRLFSDPEQPERGRFLNCPSGWTCEGVNRAKLEAYGLDQSYIDFRPGTGPAMDSAILSAYLQGRPLLFYNWSPSALAGKLRLIRLQEPPYSEACWRQLTSANAAHHQGCAAPEADIAYGVSSEFASSAPEIIALLAKANLPIALLNRQLGAMADGQISARDQALTFLREEPALWKSWVGPAIAAKISASLDDRREAPPSRSFPQAWVRSIRAPVNEALSALVTRDGAFFRAISDRLLILIRALDDALRFLPWWALIAVFMALALTGRRRVGLSILVGILLFFVGILGLWDLMLQSLSLMLLATLVTVILGVPLGIFCAKSRSLAALLRPLLDIMQTMPSFVYLIPALMLFGLGKVPAILATVIYAIPPMIRLTALGIEQVDSEVKEAAVAFGLTELQILWTVELPLARPALMAGLNQTIMLALSMVVIASMIGARGLGEQVLNGIQTLDVGLGLEAGIGIVILAIILDRITQGLGASDQRDPGRHG